MLRMENTSTWAQEVVDRVLQLRQGLGRSVSIGISGVDCAGKTTLAEAVHILLQSSGVCSVLIPGDEFTRPTADRYRNADEGVGYYLDSFDYTYLFEEILPAVRNNVAGEMIMKVSDWEKDSWRDEPLVLAADGAVIVEGCFLFADQRAQEFDLSVWIELPLASVVNRALRRPRDLERMGGPTGVQERYEARYIPGQVIHLERDMPAKSATLVMKASDE